MFLVNNELIRRLEHCLFWYQLILSRRKEKTGARGEVDKLSVLTVIHGWLSAKVLRAFLSGREKSLLIGCQDHLCL